MELSNMNLNFRQLFSEKDHSNTLMKRDDRVLMKSQEKKYTHFCHNNLLYKYIND